MQYRHAFKNSFGLASIRATIFSVCLLSEYPLNRIESLIHTHGRVTSARILILESLLKAPHALTHAEVESSVSSSGNRFDRVTIYRVLDWLVSKGLAHKIAGEDRVWRFNAANKANHGHAHFHCSECNQVFCLTQLAPGSIKLPKGYRLNEAKLIIEGLCPHCNK